jgi:hypothetical protein
MQVAHSFLMSSAVLNFFSMEIVFLRISMIERLKGLIKSDLNFRHLTVPECKYVVIVYDFLLHCIIYQVLPSSASLCTVLSSVFFLPASQIRLVLYLYLLIVSLILAPEIFQDLKLFVWFSVGY